MTEIDPNSSNSLSKLRSFLSITLFVFLCLAVSYLAIHFILAVIDKFTEVA